MLTTFAGVGLAREPGTVPPVAQFIPAAMSSSEPPLVPRTRTGRSFAFQSTPATPIVLLLAAPMVPAVCEPCQLEAPLGRSPPMSSGLSSRPSPSPALVVSEIMSMPEITRASRSGWGTMPVSMSATTTAALPWVTSHAAGRFIAA
jgi:hypothetical protein